MKVIIAGSRTITDYDVVEAAIKESGFEITEVVSGGARGPDQIGEQYAARNSICLKQFIPNWKKLGRSAGYIRNEKMAEYGEALIAVWDGESKGTKHMIDSANKKGIKVFIKVVDRCGHKPHMG